MIKKEVFEVTPCFCSVKGLLMKRLCIALETAEENAVEVYNNHINSVVGASTKKEKYLTKMLKNDAEEAKNLISELTDKYGELGI